jgi:hypothetical protein
MYFIVHEHGESAEARQDQAFYAIENGPVAQLDRVLDSESKGHAFESRRDHHLIKEGACRLL